VRADMFSWFTPSSFTLLSSSTSRAVNLDPRAPITTHFRTPANYSREIAAEAGPFYTLGISEDTRRCGRGLRSSMARSIRRAPMWKWRSDERVRPEGPWRHFAAQ